MSGWLKEKLSFFYHLFKLEDQVANTLSFFVGVVLASGGLPAFTASLIYGLAAVSFSLLGINLLNQVTDIEIDRINKPHRPLPSGKVSETAALLLTGLFFVLAIGAAFAVSPTVFLVTVVYITLGIIYSVEPLRMKERFLLSNLVTAIGYNFLNFLIGWAVFQPLISAPFALLTLLFAYDFIAINSKDYHDLPGDKKFGMKTLVSLLGVDNAMKVDKHAHFLIQAVFIISALAGLIPSYLLALSGITLVFVFVMFLELDKTRDFMRFYHMSFGMHILLRLLILGLFFANVMVL